MSTLDLKGFDPRAVLLCCAILLAFEWGLARREAVWKVAPRSNAGVVDEIEARVLPSFPSPCAVLLGSSRVRDGILPAVLEGDRLPAGSVLNLGVTAGTPFDALLFYRRHEERFRDASHIIVGVEDWYVREGIGPVERDFRFASLSDVPSYGPYGLRIFMGSLWHTYGARAAIRRFLRQRGIPGEPLTIGEDGRIDWRGALDEHIPPADSADSYFETYDAEGNSYRMEQLADLLHELEGKHAVMLLQVPLHPEYVQRIDDRYASMQIRFVESVQALTQSEHVEAMLLGDQADAIGLGPEDFEDYGHLNADGATRFSSWLATHLDITCANLGTTH